MTEYIKKEDALNAFARVYMVPSQSKAKDIYEQQIINTFMHIKSIPAADVVERKHGKWIKHTTVLVNAHDMRECSICNSWFLWDMPRNSFCPCCGAEMDTHHEPHKSK